jgi:hypothetical protein
MNDIVGVVQVVALEPIRTWYRTECKIQSFGANHQIGRYGLPLGRWDSARKRALEQMEITCLGVARL